MNRTTPISERALFARISRKLAGEGETLRRNRADTEGAREVGLYYSVNQSNHVSKATDDLERLGRELGVMMPHERLAVPSSARQEVQ